MPRLALLPFLLFIIVGGAPTELRRRSCPSSAPLPTCEISPEFWPDEELEHYLALNLGDSLEAFDDAVVGPRAAAMTVEVGNALAGHVATKVLQSKGTAADAAVAAAAANVVLNHGAFVSFAGFLSAVYYDSERGETKALHGHYRTVPENDPARLLDPDFPVGALTPIPAFFADAHLLHSTYGSGLFTFGELLAPAIWLAETGLFNRRVPALQERQERVRRVLGRTAHGRRLLAAYRSDPLPEYIPQPEVAALLRNVSQNGIEYFYKGGWAMEAVEMLRDWGSNITLDHLAEYYDKNRPVWQEPQKDELEVDGRTMHSIGASNSCAQPLNNIAIAVETFNIMRELGLMEGDKPDFTKDAETLSYYLLTARYVWYIEYAAGFLGALSPAAIQAAFWGPLAPVHEDVLLLDPISAAVHRSSKKHARNVAQAMLSPDGLERMNRVIDAFTYGKGSIPRSGVSHSDGMVIHDNHGNAISMLHTINALPFGSGLFVQGVALPDSLWIHTPFLMGPWNDRSRSVQIPDGHMLNLVTGSDGKPETLATAINAQPLGVVPAVLLTSGWGRRDLSVVVNSGPYAWPAPDPDPNKDYNIFQFVLLAKDSDEACQESCAFYASPFPANVTSNLKPWILPYVRVINVTNLTPEEFVSRGPGSYFQLVAPAVLRVLGRDQESTSIAGAVTWFSNGISEGWAWSEDEPPPTRSGSSRYRITSSVLGLFFGFVGIV